MRKTKNLLNDIVDLNNLYLAYYKAQKGKQKKPEVLEYSAKFGSNIKLLQTQLQTGNVEVGNYHYFTIYDPKQRTICAAPFNQRVLHHALMNICHPFFDNHLIANSFASRIGKGTYAALDQCRKYNCQYEWYLKLDFRKYFDSINHTVLKEQLSKLFGDKHLLGLFSKIIDSYQHAPQQGVPIGNLTSQYFSNHYLSTADHYIKQILKIPAYIRYMDDMVMWHNDKNQLLDIGSKFQDFTEKTLKLTLKPFCLNNHSQGLPFLGYLLFPEIVKLAQRSKKRFINKTNLFEQYLKSDIWTQKEYQNHVTPLIAFTAYANAKEFRKTVYLNLSACEFKEIKRLNLCFEKGIN